MFPFVEQRLMGFSDIYIKSNPFLAPKVAI